MFAVWEKHAPKSQQIAVPHGISWISGKRQPPSDLKIIYSTYIYIYIHTHIYLELCAVHKLHSIVRCLSIHISSWLFCHSGRHQHLSLGITTACRCPRRVGKQWLKLISLLADGSRWIYIYFLGYILFGLKGIVQSIMRTSVKTNSKPTSQQLKQRLPGRQIGTRLPVQLSMMPMKTIRSRECAPSAWESWAKKPKAQDGAALAAAFTALTCSLTSSQVLTCSWFRGYRL